MANKQKQVEFDLSELSLDELIEIHKDISDFLNYLEETKEEVESEDKKDE